MSERGIREYIEESIALKAKILTNQDLLRDVEEVCKACEKTLQSGGKIILAGNGGSAADAQHIATEFVSRFRFDRPALSSLSLATDTSVLTAIGNDYGFDQLFSRQIQANGKPGDMFIGISTSGNSENIIKALDICANMSIESAILTGESGGRAKEMADHCLLVPSSSTSLIQEMHIMFGHVMCAYVEDRMMNQIC